MCGLNNRALLGMCSLALGGLFVLGFSPLLHSASGPNLSSTTAAGVTVTTFSGTNDGLGAITGFEVLYSGTIHMGFIIPGCSTEPHPCLLPDVEFFYLVTDSGAYRLIPLTGPFTFTDGTRVVLTGILVTPSSLGSMVSQGYALSGDIYVQTINAA